MKKIMILLLILVAVPFAVALKTGIIIENKNYNKEDQLPSNLELHVTYEHENGTGTTEKDCFTGDEITCITRDLSGAPFNSGTGSVSWGCGECEDVTDWYTALDSTFKNGCVEGSMPNIIGKELCLQTDNVGQWNVVFSSFQSKGGGEFSYQRDYYTDSEGTTIDEEGVLYKGCVEINSGDSVYDLLKSSMNKTIILTLQ